MGERPDTSISHATYKTESSSTTNYSTLPSHREWTAFVGPVVYTGMWIYYIWEEIAVFGNTKTCINALSDTL